MGGEGTKRGTAPHRSGSWNVLKSAFHAFSGLMWVAPRTPSLRLGIVVVIALAAGGVLLRFTSVEIALLVLLGALLLAVETINTSIEMLCDYIQPQRDPKIGKIKRRGRRRYGGNRDRRRNCGGRSTLAAPPGVAAPVSVDLPQLLVRGQAKRFGKRVSGDAQ